MFANSFEELIRKKNVAKMTVVKIEFTETHILQLNCVGTYFFQHPFENLKSFVPVILVLKGSSQYHFALFR